MIFIPFLYFTCLTFFLWRKLNCVNVAMFLSAEYALTGLCAIVCVSMNWLDGGGIRYTSQDLELNVLPTFIYCLLHTILILPFALFNPRKVNEISIKHEKLFDYFAFFLLAVSLLNLYLVLDNIIQVISGGDFATLRSEHSAGEETLYQQKMKGLPRLLGYFLYFNRTTILALPCFFYSLCCLQKSKFFNVALLFSSLSVPLSGIVAADRTEMIFYLQSFCLCLCIFHPFIKQYQKRYLRIILIPLGTIMILYIGAVTISRFVDRDQGAQGGAFQYAGQGYLNFCYFFDHCNDKHIHTERMLPLYNKIIQDEIDYVELRNEISREQGFFISIFATYLGDFLCDTGITGMVIWVVLFLLLELLTLPKALNDITFGQVFWYYMLATIPMFGIFYYPYFTWLQVVCIIICAVMSILFHYNFVYKSKS